MFIDYSVQKSLFFEWDLAFFVASSWVESLDHHLLWTFLLLSSFYGYLLLCLLVFPSSRFIWFVWWVKFWSSCVYIFHFCILRAFILITATFLSICQIRSCTLIRSCMSVTSAFYVRLYSSLLPFYQYIRLDHERLLDHVRLLVSI